MEPVRYGSGSGFFRTLLAPHAPGPTVLSRLWGGIAAFMRTPIRWLRTLFVSDLARHSQILLYMRTLEGTLRMRLGREWRTGYRRALVTQVDDPSQAPSAFMEEATDLAERFSDKVDGVNVPSGRIPQEIVDNRYPRTYFPTTEKLAADEMRIVALGTGMPNQSPSNVAACFLVELGNGDSFLFDMGTGSTDRLAGLEADYSALDKVFISHLHTDHAGDLAALWAGK